MKKLAPILLMLILISCEKAVDYELPVLPSQLSIGIEITNELDSVLAGAGRSVPALSNELPGSLPGVSIDLFENGSFIGKFQEHPFYYYLHHSPVPGSKYKIDASYPGLEDAYGEVIFPETVEVISAVYDSIRDKMKITFKDPPGEDYYSFRITGPVDITSFEYIMATVDKDVSFFDWSNMEDILENTDLTKYGMQAFMTDEGFQDQIKEVEVEIPYLENTDEKVQLVFSHISYSFYEYMRTLAAYDQTSDNPFAESVKVYTNIKNGLGNIRAKNSVYEEIVFE